MLSDFLQVGFCLGLQRKQKQNSHSESFSGFTYDQFEESKWTQMSMHTAEAHHLFFLGEHTGLIRLCMTCVRFVLSMRFFHIQFMYSLEVVELKLHCKYINFNVNTAHVIVKLILRKLKKGFFLPHKVIVR